MVTILSGVWALLLFEVQPNRIPSPDPSDLASFRRQVGELFAQDINDAKSSAEKISLARRLANESQNIARPAERLAFLELARDLAVAANGISDALEIARSITHDFEVDGGKTTVDVIERLAINIRDASAKKELAEQCFTEIQHLLKHAEFEDAEDVAAVAAKLASKLKDRGLIDDARETKALIRELSNEFKDIANAIAKIESSPNDHDANLMVGRYRCFYLGDWESGLAHLAKGNDDTLADLASAELATPTNAAQLLGIADGWWQISQSLKDPSSGIVRAHAKKYYEESLTKLAGLEKARVEKRLKDEDRPASANARASKRKSEVVERLRFRSAADARVFLFNTESGNANEGWQVANGELILEGTLPTATYRRHFSSVSSVTVRGRIVPPANKNFRIAVGRFLAILNWEGNEENRFHDGSGATKSNTPPAMVPGRIHQIQIQQVGEIVKLSVDGKELVEIRETLDGTITLMTFNGKIAIQEVVIAGIPDDSVKVDRATHRLTR